MADIKTINSVPVAGIKTYDSIPLANVKTINALTMGAGATGPFEPDDIAGLQAWYKADSGVYSRSAGQFTAANSESLTIPNNSSLQLPLTGCTVGAWVWADSLNAAGCLILTKRPAPTVDFQLFTGINNLLFAVTGATTTVNASVGVVTAGAWHFCVGIFDPAGGGTASVQLDNGTPAIATGAGAFVPTTGPLGIGANPAVGGTSWDGRIQNSFVFGRILSPTELTFLYNSGNGRSYEELDTAFKTDLRAWWPLDETSGTRKDKHTNANHLTDVNTVTVNDGVVLNPASDNALISEWRDQGVAALHVSQPTIGRRALYKMAFVNGHPVLFFDTGTLRGMSSASIAAAALPVGASDGDVFVVVRPGAGLKVEYTWVTSSVFQMYANAGNLLSDWGGGPTANLTAPLPAGFENAWHLIEDYRNGNTLSELRVDNSTIASGARTTGISSGSAFFVIGTDSNYTIAGVGDIAEIVMYNIGLSTTDRAALRSYFNSKYALGF